MYSGNKRIGLVSNSYPQLYLRLGIANIKLAAYRQLFFTFRRRTAGPLPVIGRSLLKSEISFVSCGLQVVLGSNVCSSVITVLLIYGCYRFIA